MENSIQLALEALNAITSTLLIAAIMRIFAIDKTLKQILAEVKRSDKHRREEFDAMTQGE